MAVGAVGTSLNTERTLLIRRHVTAHPCRVNTLHSNDYSLFLSHTQTHTNLAVTLSLSLVHRRTHGYTDALHTKQSCFSFFITCTASLWHFLTVSSPANRAAATVSGLDFRLPYAVFKNLSNLYQSSHILLIGVQLNEPFVCGSLCTSDSQC